MELCLQALLFGLFSALSMPLGAVLGIVMWPVAERTTARWMAFGAGALVFAVATQLYGEALFRLANSVIPGSGHCGHLCQQNFANINLQTGMGVVGSLLYIALNWCLEILSRRPARDSLVVSGLGSTCTAPGVAPGVPSLSRRSFRSQQVGESNVALSMWLGMLLDGIPESFMLGFMTSKSEVTFSFLIAIFVANFPEAFSGALILKDRSMGKYKIIFMWTVIFLTTGLLAMIGSLIMPADVTKGSPLDKLRDTWTAASEGLTGGAMLAMVSTAMLPEAFNGAGNSAGVLFVLGFVVSIFITALGFRYGGPQDAFL